MLTTCLLVLVLGGLQLGQLLLSAWLLRLGARLAGAGGVGFGKAVLAALLMIGAGLAVQAAALYAMPPVARGGPDWLSDAGPIIAMILGLIAMVGVLQRFLRLGVGRALLAWLPTLLATAVGTGLAEGVVRPFLFEAYSVSENSMAPTLLGRHVVGVCPSCGGPAYIPGTGPGPGEAREDLGICGRCRRTSTVSADGGPVVSPDRLIAARFLRPGRWDLIVFRNPEDPSVVFVKRLVGLPGERVAIEGGDVWIDGRRIAKPPELSGLAYLADPAAEEKPTWGPVRLGNDEFFVLGDFSRRSKDSRLWMAGAPDRPYHAVTSRQIVGVVTHIYWPPRRWRIVR
jgi:signal peptidase I